MMSRFGNMTDGVNGIVRGRVGCRTSLDSFPFSNGS